MKRIISVLLLIIFSVLVFSCSSKPAKPKYQTKVLFDDYQPSSLVSVELVLSAPTVFMYPIGRDITFLYKDDQVEIGEYSEEIKDRHSFQDYSIEERREMDELCGNALKILESDTRISGVYDTYPKFPDMVLLIDQYGYVIICDENWHYSGDIEGYQSNALYYIYDVETERIVYAQKFTFFNYCAFSGCLIYEKQ